MNHGQIAIMGSQPREQAGRIGTSGNHRLASGFGWDERWKARNKLREISVQMGRTRPEV